MITKKEDLYGTVIEVNSSDDADFVARLCAKFGIELGYWSGCKFNDGTVCAKISHNNGAHGGYLVFSHSINGRAGDMPEFKNLKQLTLSDLKPRTKVEYEKVDLSLSEKVGVLESGEWLYLDPDGKTHIDMNVAGKWVIESLMEREVYRKVERPVEWWEDAVEFVKENSCNLHPEANHLDDGGFYVESKMTRDQWCDFARILLEQEDENQNNASS